MKMLFVFDGLGFGGIERIGVDYIRLLHGQGHEITVINLVSKQNELEKEIEGLCKVIHFPFPRDICPYRYRVLAERKWWGKLIYYPTFLFLSSILRLQRLFRKVGDDIFDLAIAFSGHINDLTVVADEFVKCKKKMCWMHGGIEGYAEISEGFLRLQSKIHNCVTLSSKNEADTIRKYPYLEGINLKKIYNPSFIKDRPLNQRKIKELQEKYGDFILMVGRFTKEKDPGTVIEAMKSLYDEDKCQNKLLFIGDGPDRRKFEEKVRELNLKEKIIFVGSVYDVQNYYVAGRLYVHSSPAEGLPTVLIESMSLGMPIVATNSLPGVPEVLDGDKAGMVCSVGNASEMAACIEAMLENDDLYERYQKAGLARAEEFLPENILHQFNDFIMQ